VTDSRLSRPQQSASEALEAHVNGNRMASTFHLVGLDFAQRQAEEIDRLRLLLSEIQRVGTIGHVHPEVEIGRALATALSGDKPQETPRTDAQHAKWRIHDDPYTGMANLAEQLERELAEANRDVTNLHECLRQAALQEDLTPSHVAALTPDWCMDAFWRANPGRNAVVPSLYLLDFAREVLRAFAPSAKATLMAEDVEWVVNDIAELGVKIGNQFFWLYKGHSLVYGSHDDPERKDGICLHDDGKPMHWRPVGKREFGECCHPINYKDPTRHGTVSLDDSDDWKPLPVPPESGRKA
jgi:hypothetical protein